MPELIESNVITTEELSPELVQAATVITRALNGPGNRSRYSRGICNLNIDSAYNALYGLRSLAFSWDINRHPVTSTHGGDNQRRLNSFMSEFDTAYRSGINELLERIAQPVEVGRITEEDIKAELLSLQKEFGTLTFSRESTGRGRLKIDSKPVTIRTSNRELNFGIFQIETIFDENYRPGFRVGSTNPLRSRSGFIHPHVSGGGPCLGSASNAIYLAFEQGRIYDAIDLCETMLHTYNPDSPYCRISDWRTTSSAGSCHRCYNQIYAYTSIDQLRCLICGPSKLYCTKHLSPCFFCGGVVCGSHRALSYDKTTKTYRKVCNTCGAICPSCDKNVGKTELRNFNGSCVFCTG